MECNGRETTRHLAAPTEFNPTHQFAIVHKDTFLGCKQFKTLERTLDFSLALPSESWRLLLFNDDQKCFQILSLT